MATIVADCYAAPRQLEAGHERQPRVGPEPMRESPATVRLIDAAYGYVSDEARSALSRTCAAGRGAPPIGGRRCFRRPVRPARLERDATRPAVLWMVRASFATPFPTAPS